MNTTFCSVLCKKFFVNKVNVCNFPCFLFKCSIIFNIDTIRHSHTCNISCTVNVFSIYLNFNFSPVHKITSFLIINGSSRTPTPTDKQKAEISLCSVLTIRLYLLFNLSSLTNSVTKIVEFTSANLTASDCFYLCNVW